jgi:hypothetical protein
MKDITKELQHLEGWIKRDWGSRCRSYSCICPICVAWKALQDLKELNIIAKALNEKSGKEE